MTMTRVRAAVPALAVTLGIVFVSSGPATAQPVPYSDPAAIGTITLCDVAGHVLTHGDIRTKPFIWRAVGSEPVPSQYAGSGRTAALDGYQPINEVDPSQWNGEYLTASATYTSRTHPMAAATPADGPLAQFLGDYPTKWDGLVELRMFLGAPQMPTLTRTYDAATIKITGNAWTLVNGGHSGCSTGTARSSEMIVPKVRALKAPSEKQYADPNQLIGSSNTRTPGTGDTQPGAATAAGTSASNAGNSTNPALANSADTSDPDSALPWLIGACVLAALAGALFWRRQHHSSPTS